VQANYELKIEKSIESLRNIHKKLSPDLLKKYEMFFTCVLGSSIKQPIVDREPIVDNDFTFYPDSGKIISACKSHIFRLTPVQNEIFYYLTKNLYTGKTITTEDIQGFIYKHPNTVHHCRKDTISRNTLFVHVCHINAFIRHLGLKIYHQPKYGWGIEKGIVGNEGPKERSIKRRKAHG